MKWKRGFIQALLVVEKENEAHCRTKHSDKEVADWSRGRVKIKSLSKLEKGDKQSWIQREETN